MSTIKTFRDLLIWRKSKELALDIYKYTKEFPREEEFGLKSQIRRSAVSVPSNIAEGFGRYQTKDFRKFLRIGIGSLFELQTQIILAYELNYFKEEVYNDLIHKSHEIEKMMNSFISKLSKTIQ